MTLSRWKEKVFKQVEEKIANLKLTSTFKSTNSFSLQDLNVKKSLQDLHNKPDASRIDKANGNAANICKRLYVVH